MINGPDAPAVLKASWVPVAAAESIYVHHVAPFH